MKNVGSMRMRPWSLFCVMAFAGALVGCDDDAQGPVSEARAEYEERSGKAANEPTKSEKNARGDQELTQFERQELLTGYELLSTTLSDEANLSKLEIVKKLMLDAPNDHISELMDKLSKVSETHGDELNELRKLGPQVSEKPAMSSPMGEAIGEIAKDFGKDDMLSREGGFDVRFVLVQAQATRMVAAISSALARFEPQPKRKAWLEKLSREYEGYRGDLIAYLGARPAEKNKKD